MPKLFDRVKVNIATTGTGDITFGAAASTAFLTPAEAGVLDGDEVRYVIMDGLDFEEGVGLIKDTVATMERTVTKSKIGGTVGTSTLNLSGTAVLALTASAADIVNTTTANTFSAGKQVVNGNSIAEPQFEVFTDDGVVQANITATTYGIDGGGIFHGNHAGGTKAAPTQTLSGTITGGYGSRPYDGSAFLTSSPASIHFVAAEDIDSTHHGAYLRFLTTAKGSTTRQERVLITQDGTLWSHSAGAFDPLDAGQTKPYADLLVLASGASGVGGAVGAFTYGGSNSGFRGGVAGGTPASPSGTPSGSLVAFLGGHGHDGTKWSSGSCGGLYIFAAENYRSGAQGTYLTLETTPTGSTARAEAMRVDPAGNILLAQNAQVLPGNTNTQTGFGFRKSDPAFSASRASGPCFVSNVNTAGNNIQIHYQGMPVGGIAVTSSSTAYNTSSDQRLKEDSQPIEDPFAVLDMIQMWDFRWKATGERDLGAFAQELFEVYPHAVTKGNDKEPGDPDFIPWAVDYSKLVPLLTAAVQRLAQRVVALEAKS